MKRLFLRGSVLPPLCLLSAFVSTSALADKTSETLMRTSTSPASVNLKLEQSIYYTYYTDDPYYVDVPYEETETYWEDVPYTTQEWVCHMVSASRAPLVAARGPVAGFDGEEPGRGGPSLGNGGNNGGDPTPPPPPPPEPPAPPPPPPQPQCGWETRTEYRQEQRTRTVTKYRQEQRCCQRNEHTSFDHMWKQPVTVNFPADPALLQGESAKVVVSLAGEEGNPSVDIESSGVLRYKVGRMQNTASGLVVDLEFTPHITAKDAGAASIGNMVLDLNSQGAQLSVQDKVSHPRVKSTFSAKLIQRPGDTVIAETAEFAKGTDGLLRAKFTGTLDPDKDYAVILSVAREGIVLQEKVAFDLPREFPAEKVDKVKLADKAQLGKFSWLSEGAKSAILFADATPTYKTVKTAYTVRISTRAGKLLVDGTINRADLAKDRQGRFLLPVKALGASRQALEQMTDGTVFKVEFTATRTSSRFQPITVKKSGELVVGQTE